jgi:ribosome maturation protein SDO1
MISVEDAVVARIERSGIHFELMVDPELALDFRRGGNVSLESVLAVRGVFKDAGRGERASEEELQKAFHTADLWKIAGVIIRQGDVQITTEHRRRLVEERRKQVAGIISKQGMDPKTNLPHPPQRILNAMDEARVHIDPFRRASDQVEGVLSRIQEVLPISMERVEVELRVPLQFAGKASSVIRGITPVKKEEWKSDAWVATIEIAAGMQSEIYGKLNELTSGQAETRVVKKGL